MILLTGGTGFVGRALARQLVTAGHSVRILLRPSQHTPDLPKGVPVEVAVASLSDERGLRAALRGVDTVYHLAGAEQEGGHADLHSTDIRGTETLVRAASGARVRRIFYVSHLGADRASAFPVLKTKGIAEEYIRQGEVPYTILRSGILFGPEDHFTTGIARLLHLSPVLFVPPRNDVLLQPLWVEDLTTCLVWSLDNDATINQTYEVAGGETFSFRQAMEIILQMIGTRRILLPLALPYLRGLTVLFEQNFRNFPTSVFWLDYISVSHTCASDSVPRQFGFLPARFAYRLEHLKSVNWRREARRTLVRRHA
jgi:NADH dehydrogenase